VADQGVELSRCVGRLECGRDRGTAFFLRTDLAVTCRHCVVLHLKRGEPIVIHVGQDSIAAVPAEPNIADEHDAVFLRLATPVTEDRVAPLVASYLPAGTAWETFGFPKVRAEQGMALEGFVARSLHSDETPRDVELTCSVTDLPTDFRGFSGSPIFIGGEARAVLHLRLDGGLGAVSLARLHSYLEEAGVRFRSAAGRQPLPGPLARELQDSVPNRRTHWRLEEALAGPRRGYVVLSGHPGSGKTLIVAGFRPAAEMRVVARYFASGHAGSELAAPHHGRLATFAQWLSNEAAIRSAAAAPARADSTVEQFSQSIATNLEALGKAAGKEGRPGVLLIDGVDAGELAPTEFIPYLPRTPPAGLAIVLTTANSEVLKARFYDLQIACEVATEPLLPYDCERLVLKRLSGRLTQSQAARVAELSQGHPLTLTYLVKEVAAALDRGEQDPVSSLGALHGGLEDYYASVWARLSSQNAARHLLILIARLRQAVPEQQLPQILTQEQQDSFLDSLNRVRHLLRSDGGALRFYHESFREFVIARSRVLDEQIHAAIAQYCESAPTAEYAVANVLHHRMNAREDPRQTSRLCTQEWADRAALACVQPELVLSDIDAILAERLQADDLEESIRLLLLRSRTQSRYDRVFARYAAGFARAAAGVRSAGQALALLHRGGHYLCSVGDTLTLLRSLSVGGHHLEAQQLFHDFRGRCWAAYEQRLANYDLLLAHLRAACIVAASMPRENVVFIVSEIRRLFSIFEYNVERSKASQSIQDCMLSNARGALFAEQLWRTGFAACNADDPVELASILEEARTIAWDHGRLDPLPARPEIPAGGSQHPMLSRQEVEEALKAASLGQVPSGAEDLVAGNLLRVSDAFSRVSELYQLAVPVVSNVALRKKNGVDPDLSSIQRVLFSHEISAYTADQSLAGRVAWSVRHEWERRFFEAAAWLGRARGQRFRARSLRETLPLSLIEHMNGEFFPLLRFSLLDRSRWEDSYHLPEYAAPRLMLFAAEAIAEFEPGSSEQFVESLLAHPDGQMGLYTEGFQRLLGVVADVLASTQNGVQPAADLRRALRTHIVKRVFAREARVQGLLDCAQHFARLGAEEDAEGAYREAVQSSLGPAWYKEDQFRLLMDAVEAVDDPQFSRSQWRKTVEILAFASGESTFQRFVRDQKERLVRHLAERGLVAEALATYRHYVLPTLSLQRSRVRRVGVDMTSGLSGDRFGVLEIDEQCGALALLCGAGAASPLKRWAVIELFWPWGDTRYFDQFAELFCGLLSTGAADAIGERFVRLLSAEVEPKRREQFFRQIGECGNGNVATPWLQAVRERGVPVPTEDAPAGPPGAEETPAASESAPAGGDEGGGGKKPELELYLPGLFGRKKALLPLKEAPQKALARIARDDFATARKTLVKALQEAQQGDWDVWEGHSDADTALGLLFARCGPLETVLGALAPLVLAEKHASSWRVAEKITLAAVRQLGADGRRGLFAVLAEHVEYLVRAERANFNVTEELDELPTTVSPISADECLDALLLSLLDHPSGHMRQRAADVIEWLARQSAFGLCSLVEHAVRDGPPDGREIAIGILHRLALQDPSRVAQIAACAEFDRLTKTNSFLARYLVEEMGRTWEGSAGGNPGAALPSEAPPYEWSFDAGSLLDTFEGGRERSLACLTDLCAPLLPAEVKELSYIRRRAFCLPAPGEGYAFEREAIFRALAGVSSTSERGALLSFVAWNPLWPDAELRPGRSALAPRIFSALESGSAESAFVVGDNTRFFRF
jgi:hypothetical protein